MAIILIVDDEKSIRETFKAWFGCQKYPIVKQHRHELILYKTT